MRLKGIVAALLFALAAPLAVEAQQPGKVFRVGVIAFGSPETASFLPPFRQRLNELGYIEGQREGMICTRFATLRHNEEACFLRYLTGPGESAMFRTDGSLSSTATEIE